MKRFLIIDGNSIMNRAFYGIRLLTNSEGLYTNAVYGFLNILFKNIDNIKPDYIAVAFDLKAPTFRHKRYAEYKAQRKGMPEELSVQMPVIKEILSAMNITILEKEGYEADDIIGTIANMCNNSGIECDIITGDKDDLQLASETTKIYLTVTSKGVTNTDIYDESVVYEKYGVTPKEFIDVKGLMGDASDNIPGVKGIGEKTAFALIQEYKSIEKVYEKLENAKIGKSAKEKLNEGRKMAFLSKELATIDINVPLNETVEECTVKTYDNDKLVRLFKTLEFKSFIDKLDTSETDEVKPAVIIDDASELSELLSGTKEFIYYIFNAATYSAIAFLKDKDVYYTELSLLHFKQIFEDESIKKITHDIKSDIVLLTKEKIEYDGYDFDVAIGGYVLDPSAADHSLSRLSLTYADRIIGFEAEKTEILKEERKTCVAATVVLTIKALKENMVELLEKNGQTDLFRKLEMPLIKVLADMQTEGFFVDTSMLEEYGKELDIRIDALQESIYFMAGEEFNINSPKQLGVVLFEHLNLPVIKKTKTGYSTDAEVLSQLSSDYEIVDAILEYRQLAKLKGTYVDGMLPLIADDGKIHSTFNQTVTATGRISSTEPNLQNIPIRLEEGRKLRKMFTAGDDKFVLVDADYSQIELRVLAHLSGDENMISAFNEGVDIHRRTAAQVFSVEYDAVTEQMRRRAKAVNFGIVYGISEFGLAKDLGISRAEAKRYIEAYFNTYPKVKEFMDNAISYAKENGYVKTLFGRIRYIPEITSGNYNVRSFGERVAMNTPVQGTAADIIKIAMARVSKALKEETINSKLILQVHDELIVLASKEEEKVVRNILKREMESAAEMTVKLEADVNSGYSWYDAK